ncbi:unnamed protein product [Diabrotica balteata]|uniref:Uncharacterized protein n=1 Tax=Diabrotica balteata TaxID=107213 RepID=A0A9P0DZ73_DIABA|nr:unnamed protein product [Diabrotica balteata]
MKFSQVVSISLLLLTKYVRSDFTEGQPCTEKNTAYLTDEHQTIPEIRIYCVDVTGFKSNVDGNANLDQYKSFFDASQTAETLYSNSLELTSFPVNVISSLPNLQLVDLNFNHITNLPTELFKYAPNIKTLLLAGNRILVPEEGPLLVSDTLETLMLTNNLINKLYESTFKELPNLHVLYIDDNNLQDLVPIYGTVPNLQYLDVRRNYIKHLPSRGDISTSLKRYFSKPQKELQQ